MRKISYLVHTSVDGYIEGPNGEFDWPRMGQGQSDYTHDLIARVDTFLYGRAVWDMMAGYWPNAESMSSDPHDLRFAPIWRTTSKIVFSRTLKSADWGARVIGGDIAQEVTALKTAPGKDMLLMGGSEMAGVLAQLGLIDEFHVFVHPVVLGAGKSLLSGVDRIGLRLTDTRSFDSRTTLLRYEIETEHR